jgi:C4-dicarboxylate-specific signal transduction histidine kinase
VLDLVAGAMAHEGYIPRHIVGVRQALGNVLTNALGRAHGAGPEKVVLVRDQVRASRVLAEVRDEGTAFDPAGRPARAFHPTFTRQTHPPGKPKRGIALLSASAA